MKLDVHDPINAIELALQGQEVPETTFKADELAAYLTYIKALVDIDSLDVIEDNHANRMYERQYKRNQKFINNLKVHMRRLSRTSALGLSELVDLVKRIKSQSLENLTSQQFNFFNSTDVDSLEDFIGLLDLPKLTKLTRLDARKPEHSGLKACLEGAENDKLMSRHIISMWEIDSSRYAKPDLKSHLPLVHGTTSLSMLSILDEGFKVMSGSEMYKQGASYSGRAFGQGVYFARPSQISKTQYYQRDDEQGWIIVADVYYNDITTYEKVRKNNIKLVENAGAYSRDELIAQPHQIVPRYIIETSVVRSQQ